MGRESACDKRLDPALDKACQKSTMPGTELQMRFATANAEAESDFIPTNSTVLKHGEVFSFRGGGTIIDAQGRPVRASFSGLKLGLPTHLGNYEHINVDVKGARFFCQRPWWSDAIR
jgi:hypothetical protein